MKTILINLIKNYKPISIDYNELVYEIDVYGEKQIIKVSWEINNSDDWEFSLAEPSRVFVSPYVSSGLNFTHENSNNLSMRTCYSVKINNFTYKVPLTLEESNYLDLLTTQLFQSVQNEKLSIIKSVIENEAQKEESDEQVS